MKASISIGQQLPSPFVKRNQSIVDDRPFHEQTQILEFTGRQSQIEFWNDTSPHDLIVYVPEVTRITREKSEVRQKIGAIIEESCEQYNLGMHSNSSLSTEALMRRRLIHDNKSN